MGPMRNLVKAGMVGFPKSSTYLQMWTLDVSRRVLRTGCCASHFPGTSVTKATQYDCSTSVWPHSQYWTLWTPSLRLVSEIPMCVSCEILPKESMIVELMKLSEHFVNSVLHAHLYRKDALEIASWAIEQFGAAVLMPICTVRML